MVYTMALCWPCPDVTSSNDPIRILMTPFRRKNPKEAGANTEIKPKTLSDLRGLFLSLRERVPFLPV